MKPAKFSTIGIIGKYEDPNINDTIVKMCGYFRSQKLEVLIDENTAEKLEQSDFKTGDREMMGKQCDLAVVIGGDGTLLNAARSLSDFNVPIVGINLGHLGFLADISPDKMMESMDEILAGNYEIEERSLLQCHILRDGEKISESDAFNDIVIHKWNVARMIGLETYINGRFLNKLRSDGVIISTPTGSTAYALSAGGPILHPRLDALVIVPVSPHTMSNRPLVVEDNSEIEVVICESKHENAQVTCDGQITFSLMSGDRIQIRKKTHPVKLIHLLPYDYYEILRAKLHWSETPNT